MTRLLSLLTLLAALPLGAWAGYDDWSDRIEAEDREVLEALALYPAETRTAILTAGEHPEVLVRLERLQGESQRAFEAALEGLERDDQEAIWNLTREPDLIRRLAEAPRTDAATLERIAADYSSDLRADILDQGARNQNVLRDVYGGRLDAETAFDDLLSPYPRAVQDAYTHLVGLPELLDILGEHLNLTVLVADLHRQDPAGVDAFLDQVAAEAAEKQAAALDDWQAQLESDPAMREELEAAAADYADEQGWDASEYSVAPPEPQTRVQVVYNPYPYWYGYPWWYSTPRWYPYPWWYDWGFYYGPRSSVVVFGMPTWHFWTWYYRYPNRYYRYPALTAGCVGFYYAHPRSGVALVGPTRDYVRRAERLVGEDALKDRGRREQAIRDLGRLEEDVIRRGERDASPDRAELVRRNPERYPSLDPDRVAAATERPRQPVDVRRPQGERDALRPERPVTAPATRPSAEGRPERPATAPSARPMQRPERPVPVPATRPEDRHHGTWSRPATPSRSTPSRTAPSRSEPSRTAPTRSEPPRSASPSRSAPSRSTAKPPRQESRRSGRP
jgi:hypothetical protein